MRADMVARHSQRNALDILEEEDRRLLTILAAIDDTRDDDVDLDESVEARARYGDLVKRLTRDVAIREAAQLDVARGLEGLTSLSELGERMESHASERRQHIDAIERMSRGVAGISLNTGQDLDPELRHLADIVRTEIDWELGEAIPTIRTRMPAEEQLARFRSARWIRRHAPTSLDPNGPRWHERARVVSWLCTIFDRIRDHPTATQPVD
jgi:hypothetical protein